MKDYNLERVLLSQPYAHYNQEHTQIQMRCPVCGDSYKNRDSTHFTIKVNVEEGEAYLYFCHRADCRAAGALRSDFMIKKFGCTDVQALSELTRHNATISKNFDKNIELRFKKGYTTINLNNKSNIAKLDYLNKRLGLNLSTSDLKRYKIQLGIRSFINVNEIKKTTVPLKVLDLLDRSCIGFISMYDDFIIMRDITAKLETGKRYTNYRIKKGDEDATKMYCLPGDIDIIDDSPAVIHVAEGVFSILGAYHHTDFDRNYRNQLFLANCGAGYIPTVSRACRQYGLTDLIVHIYSDSEIKLKFYDGLLRVLRENAYIRKVVVHYNTKKEDFGHRKEDIKVSSSTLYDAEDFNGGVIRL